MGILPEGKVPLPPIPPKSARGLWGTLLLLTAGNTTRLPQNLGCNAIYLEFIETAPWNLEEGLADRRFTGVGTALMKFAVRRSQALGSDGILLLHTLEQSRRFYANHCGMLSGGFDAGYNDLKYFEFTPAAATAFLIGANP